MNSPAEAIEEGRPEFNSPAAYRRAVTAESPRSSSMGGMRNNGLRTPVRRAAHQVEPFVDPPMDLPMNDVPAAPPPRQPMNGMMNGMRQGAPAPRVMENGPAPAVEYADGGMMQDDGGYMQDGYGGDCGGCNDGCCGPCWPFFALPCLPLFQFGNLEVQGGVHGFTGPANRGSTASFGFHEGLNFGSPIPFMARAVSLQIGAQATQSNFNGADFTIDERNQAFVTGGLFRRVDAGLQGGVVVDYMHDSWYYNVDLTQLRGELSWVFGCGQEIGVWGTAGFKDEVAESRLRVNANVQAVPFNERWQVNEIYAAFYRQQIACNGEGRFWGGFTGDGDGILGANLRLPLTTCVDFRSDFTYLIPHEDIRNNGVQQEAWNISIGLAWYPGCRVRCSSPYDRPLFNVADNGSFMVNRVIP